MLTKQELAKVTSLRMQMRNWPTIIKELDLDMTVPQLKKYFFAGIKNTEHDIRAKSASS